MASGPAAHYSDVELTSALSQAGVTLSDDELGSDSVSGAGPGGSQGSRTELEGDPMARRETLVGSEQASALNVEKKRSEEEVEESEDDERPHTRCKLPRFNFLISVNRDV